MDIFNDKVTMGFLLALIVQTGSALLWAGAAAERLNTLEKELIVSRHVSERLARVEVEIDAVRHQLNRIEAVIK